MKIKALPEFSGGRKVVRMIELKEKLAGLAIVALAMAAVLSLPL